MGVGLQSSVNELPISSEQWREGPWGCTTLSHVHPLTQLYQRRSKPNCAPAKGQLGPPCGLDPVACTSIQTWTWCDLQHCIAITVSQTAQMTGRTWGVHALATLVHAPEQLNLSSSGVSFGISRIFLLCLQIRTMSCWSTGSRCFLLLPVIGFETWSCSVFIQSL